MTGGGEPPLSKGRWICFSKDGGIVLSIYLRYKKLFNHKNNHLVTIPHPFHGSPLCTKGPYFAFSTLHFAFICCHAGTKRKRSDSIPLNYGVYLLY